jgi:N-acetylglucosaminyldiphosphoundecaprenol N-acetyl-beta-D-mannosaminyltransferase
VRKKVDVLNVHIDAVTMGEAIVILEEFINARTPHFVATANAEMVMMAQQDTELADILNKADLVVPDGAGVVWAARFQGNSVPERVAGFDLVQQLLKRAECKGYRIFMFGGAPGVAEKARDFAQQRYPKLVVSGTCDGFFTPATENEILEKIRLAHPDILLVGLGVPKQEKWLARNLLKLGVPIAIGVGGTFDVMAGTVKRAPVWMQRANLEWLFRLLSQPQRAVRMLALPRFVVKVMTQKH